MAASYSKIYSVKSFICGKLYKIHAKNILRTKSYEQMMQTRRVLGTVYIHVYTDYQMRIVFLV